MSSIPPSTKSDFLEILDDRCILCAACVAVCEPESLALNGRSLLFEGENCSACSDCFRVCPAAALAPRGGQYYRGIS